jgi:hypothetical protein
VKATRRESNSSSSEGSMPFCYHHNLDGLERWAEEQGGLEG